MVGDPVVRRIGVDEVGVQIGPPTVHVGFDEEATRQRLAGLLEHRWRRINAEGLRFRIATSLRSSRACEKRTASSKSTSAGDA
jgi:hypothetical protein